MVRCSLKSEWISSVLYLDQWLSAFPMLQPSKTVPHNVVIPSHRIISLLLHYCSFCYYYESRYKYLICNPLDELTTHGLGITGLDNEMSLRFKRHYNVVLRVARHWTKMSPVWFHSWLIWAIKTRSDSESSIAAPGAQENETDELVVEVKWWARDAVADYRSVPSPNMTAHTPNSSSRVSYALFWTHTHTLENKE